MASCDGNDNVNDSDSSPFKDLLHQHELTILGNFSFMDELEKEACTETSTMSVSSNPAKFPSTHRSNRTHGLSPIECIESSKNDSLVESPKYPRSPILSGPSLNKKRKRRSKTDPLLNQCGNNKDNSDCSATVDSVDSAINAISSLKRSLNFYNQYSSNKQCYISPVDLKNEPTLSHLLSQGNTFFGFSDRMAFVEDERPWDYSVQAPVLLSESGVGEKSKQYLEDQMGNVTAVLKTPKSDSAGIAEKRDLQPLQQCTAKHELYSSLKGISRIINSTVFNGNSSPDQFLTGLSLIDWDEPMYLDKEYLAHSSPKSIPFSERFHQQLLKNNDKPVEIPNNGQRTVDLPALQDSLFFGLPLRVKTLIQKLRGISELYDWQKNCLSMPEVQDRCNLVYALPTSGGKTLVAEILLLKEILLQRRNCLFVLPYVSIVQEKVRALSQLAVELDFCVEEYAGCKGSYPPRKRRCKNSVYVATIEKALGLISCLIMEQRLHEVGLVIVDELHLLGEGSRGATLEAALSELVFTGEKIQIVGMSATIGNLEEIAAFLNAKMFTGDFRPVELLEYVKCGSTIYSINRDLIGTDESPLVVHRTLISDYDQQQLQKDPDQIGSLVGEVVPDGSCLVFCPSRKNAENVALLISETLPKSLGQIRKEEKKSLYKALAAEGNGAVCPVLVKTLPFGVAYHHSGLTTAERRLLEEAFLASTICVICCTSTLAAGVNLPAKRVILRSPYIGTEFIDLSRYKQMVGRAGRTGFGGSGESILMCLFQDTQKVLTLLSSSMTESMSSLQENDSAGLKALIMSSVSLQQTTCREDVYNLMKHTLLWVQAAKLGVSTMKLADKCIVELVEEGALSVETGSSLSENESDLIFASKPPSDPRKEEKQLLTIRLRSKLSLSRIGNAAVKGSLTMTIALQLYNDMRIAQENLVLLNHLHLLYIVTPYNMVNQIKSSHQVYFNVYMTLSPEELKTANTVGITEAVVFGIVRGRPIRAISQAVIDRFYLTLMLYDLWNEKSVWEVSIKFQVPRGQVHNLLVAASAFAASALRFSEAVEELWCFKVLLGELTQRLAHCCSAELLPLMELPAVKLGRARQLYNAGFRSLIDVAKADPVVLVRELDHMPRKTAYQIVAAAKLLLMDKAEALREEASDVLDGLFVQVGGSVTPG